jgi:enoyl-CoA hydratase/carnithine racemase
VGADYETLLYEESDGVAVVTLNRPEVLNAFNQLMQNELRQMWRSLRGNDDVRAVILTGAGDEAFCTGIDREETFEKGYIPRHQDRDRPDLSENRVSKAGRVSTPFMYNDVGNDINPKANDLWKPVVAAVNGMACAGGLYLLGESDVIIAAENATFFDPHVSYGLVCGFEGIHILQKLPLGETLRLALMGQNERISAARAYQVGLVSEVVPQEKLMEAAMVVASAIASAPVLAIQGTLRAIWMAHELSRRAALAQASTLVHLGSEFENIAEGQAVFKGERAPFRLR